MPIVNTKNAKLGVKKEPEAKSSPAVSPYHEPGTHLFKPGNPGKKAGIQVKKYALLDALGLDLASELSMLFIQRARAGNLEALGFVMDRLFPKTSQRHTVRLNLRPFNLATMQGVSDACTYIIHEVCAEKLAIQDAVSMINLLNWKQNINVTKLENDVINYISDNNNVPSSTDPVEKELTLEEYLATKKDNSKENLN